MGKGVAYDALMDAVVMCSIAAGMHAEISKLPNHPSAAKSISLSPCSQALSQLKRGCIHLSSPFGRKSACSPWLNCVHVAVLLRAAAVVTRMQFFTTTMPTRRRSSGSGALKPVTHVTMCKLEDYQSLAAEKDAAVRKLAAAGEFGCGELYCPLPTFVVYTQGSCLTAVCAFVLSPTSLLTTTNNQPTDRAFKREQMISFAIMVVFALLLMRTCAVHTFTVNRLTSELHTCRAALNNTAVTMAPIPSTYLATMLEGSAWVQKVSARAGRSSVASQALQRLVHRLQQDVGAGFGSIAAIAPTLHGLSASQLQQLKTLAARAEASTAAWATDLAGILHPLPSPVASHPPQPAADTALWVQGAMAAAGKQWMHSSLFVQAPLASMAATLSASAQQLIAGAAAGQHVSSAQAEQLQSVVEGSMLGMLQETSTILQQQQQQHSGYTPAAAAASSEEQQVQLESILTAADDDEPSSSDSINTHDAAANDAPAAINYTSAVPPMLLLLQQCGTVAEAATSAQHTAPAPGACQQQPSAADTPTTTVECEECERCELLSVLQREAVKAVGSIKSWAAHSKAEGSQAYHAAKEWASSVDNWKQVSGCCCCVREVFSGH